MSGDKKIISRARRLSVAIGGGWLLIIGIIAIPYPGPGWLIVFAALALLGTEFEWARKALTFARARYDVWQEWVLKQNTWIKIVLFVFTSMVVVVTIWLLNGYGLINSWLNLNQDWVRSPFLK